MYLPDFGLAWAQAPFGYAMSLVVGKQAVSVNFMFTHKLIHTKKKTLCVNIHFEKNVESW